MVADVVHRRQADRRPVGVERVAVQRVHPLGVHVPQHPVVGHARRERPARPRQRRLVRRRQDARNEASRGRSGCPVARPSTAAPAGIRPVATSASHPSAAAATVSNCAGDQLGRDPGRVRRRRRLRPVDQRAHRLADRDHRHADTGQLLREVPGGAHIRTSAPSSCNRTARPNSGSTSPRDPHVDNNTRISRPPFPQVLASASDSAARPGSCRKPPGALYIESGRELLLPFSGDTPSSMISLSQCVLFSHEPMAEGISDHAGRHLATALRRAPGLRGPRSAGSLHHFSCDYRRGHPSTSGSWRPPWPHATAGAHTAGERRHRRGPMRRRTRRPPQVNPADVVEDAATSGRSARRRQLPRCRTAQTGRRTRS